MLGVFLDQPFEQQAQQQTNAHREHEEAHGLEQRQADVAAALEAGQQRQGDDADDVVDDGGGKHGGAHAGAELAQLAQGFDRDADAGGRQDAADKQRVEQLIRIRSRAEAAHEAQRADCAQRNGDDHARASDGGCGKTALFQLAEIGLQPAGEQDEHHAHLGKALQNIHLRLRGMDETLKAAQVQFAKDGRSDQKTRQDHAHHLRQPQLAGQHAQQLGRQQDHGDVHQDIHDVKFHGNVRLSPFFS